MKNLAAAALTGGLFLAGCAQQAGQPVVTLSGAQAEAGAILSALEAGAAVYTSAASTTPAEAQAVENVLAPAKAAVAAFQAAQANETPAELAETASQDITAVLAVLPIDPNSKTAIDAGLAVIDGLVAGLAATPGTNASGLTLAVSEKAVLPVPIPAPHVLPPRV